MSTVGIKPTVLDLYAGAGGLSLGFKQAGFNVIGAVEIDKWAADTYEANFNHQVIRKRVSELGDEELRPFEHVDVVCGGPPCQGFSIAARNRTTDRDPRNDEVFHFLNVAFRLRPRYILIENVAQFAKYRVADGRLLVEELRSQLSSQGYACSFHLLNASHFGVPQNRQRFFLIASRTNNLLDLSSFEGTKASGLFSDYRLVTVHDALSDLPTVEPRKIEENALLRYSTTAQNEYQKKLRASNGSFYNHVPMRHTPRLIERFSKIAIGGNGSSVWDQDAPRKRGDLLDKGSRFEQNHRRMDPNQPAPTITAFMYSTCLHPYENRNITVREAARLQSFPDSYRFTGKRTTLSNKLLEKKGLLDDIGLDQMNQVGNAVPPLLAEVLAKKIREAMNNE